MEMLEVGVGGEGDALQVGEVAVKGCIMSAFQHEEKVVEE